MGLNKNGDLMNGHLFGATCGRDLRSGVAERSCGMVGYEGIFSKNDSAG